jgi:hypothetical protein
MLVKIIITNAITSMVMALIIMLTMSVMSVMALCVAISIMAAIRRILNFSILNAII